MSNSETDINQEPDIFQRRPTAKWIRNPLAINAILFGVYSLIMMCYFWTDGELQEFEMNWPAIVYAMILAIHVIINLVICFVFMFFNKRNAGLSLLSALCILIIGFSTCAGMVNIFSRTYKSSLQREREEDSIKIREDSLRKEHLFIKKINDSTDSITNRDQRNLINR